MTSLDLNALDRWITGGRYSKALIRAYCEECEEWSPVTAESEYGATYWTPEECPTCGSEWSQDATWDYDEDERGL